MRRCIALLSLSVCAAGSLYCSADLRDADKTFMVADRLCTRYKDCGVIDDVDACVSYMRDVSGPLASSEYKGNDMSAQECSDQIKQIDCAFLTRDRTAPDSF